MFPHQPNTGKQDQAPNVNLVFPEVAAITLAQQKEMQTVPEKAAEPKRVWKKLKQEATQITKELEKKNPAVELRQPSVPTQVWVRRPTVIKGPT